VLSFQRFAWPEAGIVKCAPASLGALPVGLSAAQELLLPLAENECFWIGLSAAPATRPIALAVTVELRSGRVIDAISGTAWDADRATSVKVPGTPRIEGIRRADGRFDALVRENATRTEPRCTRVCFRLAAAKRGGGGTAVIMRHSESRDVLLRLVSYATFAKATGRAPPDTLNPDAGYKGWRLP
jgi:hypothetical protein